MKIYTTKSLLFSRILVQIFTLILQKQTKTFHLLQFALDNKGEFPYNIIYIVFFRQIIRNLFIAHPRRKADKYEFKGSKIWRFFSC